MKKIICLLLAVLLLVSGMALAEESETTQTQTVDMSSYLVILHSGELYADPQAGMGLLRAGLIRSRLETAGATVLLLDSGNSLYGSDTAYLDKGVGMASLMQQAGYSAVAVGEQEALLGEESINALAAGGLKLVGQSGGYEVLELTTAAGGSLKVGMFCLKKEDANPMMSALDSVQALEEQSCDLIIGLCGAEEETAREVAGSVDGIDILLMSGEEPMENGEWQESGTLLAQAGAGLATLGCIVVDDQGNATAMQLDETYFEGDTVDEAFTAKLSEVTAAQEALLHQVIATSAAELSGENSDAAQSVLGSWTADAVRSVTGAEMAFLTADCFGSALASGEITCEMVMVNAFPADKQIVTAQMSGEEIISLLENAVASYPEKSADFVQVSGLYFSIDPAQAAGSRVHSVMVNGQAIDPKGSYLVALNEELTNRAEQRFGKLSHLVCDYLTEQTAVGEQTMEARITEAVRPVESKEPEATDAPAAN